MKKKKNGGFTLVELLAVLAVLSLISSIAVILIMDVIDKANEKSYQTTINNVLTMAESYVIENPENSEWKECSNSIDNCEYKCVTMANMIELGYFDNDILETNKTDDTKFTKNDSVYVERDSVTKTIKTKSLDDPNCSANAIGNINFIVSPSGWSREKTITIEYELNADVNMNDAKYSSYYLSSAGYQNNSNLSFNSLIEEEKVTVNTSGSLNATINTSNGSYTKSYYVTKIDKTAPSGSMMSLHKLAYNQTVQLTLNDSVSGIKGFYFGKSNPASTTVEFESVANLKNMTLTKEVDSGGIWYLQVMDMAGNVSNPASYMFFETKLNIQNINFGTNRILDVPGSEYDLSKLKMEVHKYYTLNGWYNDENYNNAVSTPEEYPLSILPLYGKVTENVFEGDIIFNVVSNDGSKLSVDTKDITMSNHKDKTPKYEYQWYYNDVKSNDGGTAITGATSSSYSIPKLVADKYFYVTVTAKYDNYRDKTFISIPIKKNPTKIVGNLLTYNGTRQELLTIQDITGNVCFSVVKELTSCSESTSTPTRINAGTYNVYYYADGNSEYTSISNKIPVKIEKANNTVKVKIMDRETYTGESFTLITATDIIGSLYYSIGDTPLSATNYNTTGKLMSKASQPQAVNAGTYRIYWYVKSNNNNYKDASGNGYAIIDKAKGKLELANFEAVAYENIMDDTKFLSIFSFKYNSNSNGIVTREVIGDVSLEDGADYRIIVDMAKGDKENLYKNNTIKIKFTSAATTNHTSASAKFIMVRFGYDGGQFTRDEINNKINELYGEGYSDCNDGWDVSNINRDKFIGYIYCFG